jgi:hypothetical protein
LGEPAGDRFAETNLAARLTFHGSKIIKGQIRISWPALYRRNPMLARWVWAQRELNKAGRPA